MSPRGALEFGHLPERYSVSAGDISISPLPTFGPTVTRLQQSGLIDGGWCYPPILSGSPYAATWFELPRTHVLLHKGTSSAARLNFLVTAIGFLLGYQLLPEGHGHLQRTPMRRSLVTDLQVSPRELQQVLPTIDAAWLSWSMPERRMILAVIQAYQWGVACRRDFEELTFLYSALDAVFAFHARAMTNQAAAIGHWGRARELCRHLGMPIPSWARKQPSVRGARTQSGLSRLRNQLSHEALFAGAPLGYATERRPITLGLQGLVSRAVVAALGIRCSYTSTLATSQQMIGIGLLP